MMTLPDSAPSAKSDVRRFESAAPRSDAVRPRVKSMARVVQVRRFMENHCIRGGLSPAMTKCVRNATLRLRFFVLSGYLMVSPECVDEFRVVKFRTE